MTEATLLGELLTNSESSMLIFLDIILSATLTASMSLATSLAWADESNLTAQLSPMVFRHELRSTRSMLVTKVDTMSPRVMAATTQY